MIVLIVAGIAFALMGVEYLWPGRSWPRASACTHDGVFFEEQGIPTATVISAEFVIPHPLQPLTREEALALADRPSTRSWRG